MVSFLLLIIALNFSICFSKDADYFKVERVIDGDTVILEKIGRVRLIGVDTSETVDPRKPVQYFGKEASNFLKSFLKDGTFVNLKIVEEGFGFAYTKYPFQKMEQFRSAEHSAHENKRGLWAEKPVRAQKELDEYASQEFSAREIGKLYEWYIRHLYEKKGYDVLYNGALNGSSIWDVI